MVISENGLSYMPTPSSETSHKPEKLDKVKLEKKGSNTLHAQLSNFIREKIYTRAWEAGSQIPSEHELMATFGLARGTVRRALKSLVDEGLLYQVHGRGTFVTEGGVFHPAGRGTISFATSLQEQGKEFVTQTLDQVVLPVPEDVANELDAETGEPFLFLRRVRSVGGEPIMVIESWTSLKHCPGVDKADYTVESGNEAVERCSGRHVAYAKIRYTARAAGTDYANYLDCNASTPLLMLEQTLMFGDRTPFEWSLTALSSGQAVIGEAYEPE